MTTREQVEKSVRALATKADAALQALVRSVPDLRERFVVAISDDPSGQQDAIVELVEQRDCLPASAAAIAAKQCPPDAIPVVVVVHVSGRRHVVVANGYALRMIPSPGGSA